jgi:hypothetical protein
MWALPVIAAESGATLALIQYGGDLEMTAWSQRSDPLRTVTISY